MAPSALSDDTAESRTCSVEIPSKLQAAAKDRKVRVEGCVKYSMACKCDNRQPNFRLPACVPPCPTVLPPPIAILLGARKSYPAPTLR